MQTMTTAESSHPRLADRRRNRGLARAARALICLVLLLFVQRVSAYNFSYRVDVSPGGTFAPARWASLPISLLVDNEDAEGLDILPEVQSAAQTWNLVDTAQDVFGTVTKASVDFTAANYGTAWGKLSVGVVEVVVDFDGTIFDMLATMEPDFPVDADGFASKFFNMQGGTTIVGGYIVISSEQALVKQSSRESTITHELGHSLGLDHSQVGLHHVGESMPSAALDRISDAFLPTMHTWSGVSGFPPDEGETLEADDIAAISELYPAPNFATSFATISGTVRRCDGTPVNHASVRAVLVSDRQTQIARETGYNGNANGFFSMSVPPGTYKLIVEARGANDMTADDVAVRGPAIDTDFPSEYFSQPEVQGSRTDPCGEELPDMPLDVGATAGFNVTANFQVDDVAFAFVIDDTGSMGEEISAVKEILGEFIDKVSLLLGLEGTIGFPTTAIVTFKDGVLRRLVSGTTTRLRSEVNGLSPGGGGDCEESANAALLEAGRLLGKEGVALLFTDADARDDGPNRETVKQVFNEKSLTLSTMLSGTCSPSSRSTAAAVQTEARAGPGTDGRRWASRPSPFVPLGTESAIRTFSELTAETGGLFAYLPGIKGSDSDERQRYVNVGTNVALASAVPTVGLVTPGDVPQGSTLTVEIMGQNTSFLSTSAVSFTGGGITVDATTVLSAQRIIADLTIASGASLGFRDVVVTTNLGGGVERAEGVGPVRVVATPTTPTILGVTPSVGTQGTTLDVTVSAFNTSFANGVTTADFGAGVVVNATTVTSATSAVVNVSIDAAASIGFRNVTLTTGGETADESGVGPFLVSAPPPVVPRLTVISPTESLAGETLTLTVTGENTTFEAGVTVASLSGTGITVNSTTVLSPTQAEVNLTIDAAASAGFLDVRMTTGAELAVRLRGFLVRGVSSVTVLSPATGSFAATSPFITLAGAASPGAVKVSWTTDHGASGTADGTTDWRATGIPVRAGATRITVTAAYGAGVTTQTLVTATVDSYIYYLSEGATGSFFDLDILLANPNDVPAPVTITFLKDDGTSVAGDITLLPTSRITLRADLVSGVGAGAVSTVVESTAALPLVVERTMFWDPNWYGGHGAKAGEGAQLEWLFAEGSQGFFDTWVLLANPQPRTITATVDFLTDFSGTVSRTFTLLPTSRLNVFAGGIPELINKSFGIRVRFSEPGVAERAMYFGAARFWDGGHESAGVVAPARSWFHAEGATGDFFDTFILIVNPNATPATVTLTYLLGTGATVTRVRVVPADTRLTVNLELEDPLLAEAAVSTLVTSDVPVVSERAMYWPGSFTSWYEAHNSFGATELATKWGLAEGEVGGGRDFETYILLANPQDTSVSVTVTFLRVDGTTVVKTFTVAPTSRFNVWVNAMVPELRNETFGAVIESTQPIAVERAMYWTALGAFWAGGTNAVATRLP